jgi:hypothetical protein
MVNRDTEADWLKRLEQALKLAIPESWTWTLSPKPPPAPRKVDVYEQFATVLRPDAELHLSSPSGERQRLNVQLKVSVSPSEIVRLRPLYDLGKWVIAAPVIGPRTREVLNESQINWIEFEGDCRIRVGGLSIERTVRRKKTREVLTTERRYVANPFRGGALRIVRWLLTEPERVWSASEIRARARVSPGFVSRTLATLERDAYAVRVERGVRVADASALLIAWAKTPSPPDERLERVAVDGPGQMIEQVRNTRKPPAYALTTEAGADLIAPFARVTRVEMYVDDATAWDRLLKLEVVPRGGNVILILPDDAGVFDGRQVVSQLQVVSWPQLFVDLYRKGGAARDAAIFMMEKRDRMKSASDRG